MTGELSTAAIRLLVALRAAEAYGPDRALTDRVLAERTRLPVRQVIDCYRVLGALEEQLA